MTQECKQLLRGMALGDGYISLYKGKYRLYVTHCERQKAYVQAKANLLQEAFGKNITLFWVKNGGYGAYRFSLGSIYLKFVHMWLYPQGYKKISISFLRRLTDQSIAIWYMDDGSLSAKKKNGKIHAYDLQYSLYVSKEEAEQCILFFKERYQVSFTLKKHKGKYSIRCGTKDARVLLAVLKKYMLPSMEYKFRLV